MATVARPPSSAPGAPPAPAGPAAREAPPLRAGPSRLARRENLAGWLWASPWILGFLLWTLGPMVWSLYLAFTKYNISQPAEWIGLTNFVNALSGADSLFW